MLSEETLALACSAEKKMYTCLCEIADLTDQLSEAVNRQDQVSVRMFLSMRQEEIDRLLGHRAALRRQCLQLPTQDGARLRRLLNGEKGGEPLPAGAAALLRQVQSNRSLLERVCRADRAVSRRFGGSASFYADR